jgi:hypothetical protein
LENVLASVIGIDSTSILSVAYDTKHLLQLSYS